MRIDDRVEDLVRSVLDAVVSRDPARLQQAIGAFPDDRTTTDGYRLAATVALIALEDQHGRRPADDEVRQAAEASAGRQAWTGVTAAEIAAFVSAVHRREPIDRTMAVDRALLIAYVLAGDLLAAHHRAGEQWWDYLDRIESAVEAAG